MSKVNGADFGQDVAEILIESNKAVDFPTNLIFLKQHKGIRKGKMHLFIGVSGGGKSTLTRTILLDVTAALKKGKKVGVWLSEETSVEFLTQLAYSGVAHNAQLLLDRMVFFSEQDADNLLKSPKEKFEEFASFFSDENFDVVFFDNITTSNLYADKKPDVQVEIIKKLKAQAQKTETALVLIAHSGAAASANQNRLIEANDIRGSKQAVNLSEYVYLMQTFNIKSRVITTLRIEKSRSHSVSEKFFQLGYDSIMKTYSTARALDFEAFKAIFKERDKL